MRNTDRALLLHHSVRVHRVSNTAADVTITRDWLCCSRIRTYRNVSRASLLRLADFAYRHGHARWGTRDDWRGGWSWHAYN